MTDDYIAWGEAAPLRDFYTTIASGQTPHAADLEAEGIPRSLHGKVHDDVRKIHKLRDEGARLAARTLAKERAHALIKELGEDWDGAPDEPLPTDPRGLADLIRRH